MRDWANRLCSILTLVIVGITVAIVSGPDCLRGWLRFFGAEIGGAAGIGALVSALTGVAVFLYLVETTRLRRATEAQRFPFLVPQWEYEWLEPDFSSDLPAQIVGQRIVLRNLGGGPAANVELRWSGVTARCSGKTRLSALSAVTGLTLLLVVRGDELEYKDLEILVTCTAPFLPTGVKQFSWLWRRDPSYAEGFRMESSAQT